MASTGFVLIILKKAQSVNLAFFCEIEVRSDCTNLVLSKNRVLITDGSSGKAELYPIILIETLTNIKIICCEYMKHT
jgi:hypothetical protein